MLAIVLVLALAAVLAPALSRRFDDRAGWALALAPAAAFLWFAAHVGVVAAGGTVVEAFPWVAALGVDVALRLDGLSLLFALLVTGIGTLVVLYAG